MFSLTVLDHVRLDCEHAAQNYTIHARAADRFAALAFWVRMVMAILLSAAAAASVAALIVTGRSSGSRCTPCWDSKAASARIARSRTASGWCARTTDRSFRRRTRGWSRARSCSHGAIVSLDGFTPSTNAGLVSISQDMKRHDSLVSPRIARPSAR